MYLKDSKKSIDLTYSADSADSANSTDSTYLKYSKNTKDLPKSKKHLIKSYGIILFKIVNGKPKYLMVCRKSTYYFVDYILGKYNEKNREYLKFMIQNMTISERRKITVQTYEQLWNNLYYNERAPHGNFFDYVKKKFECNKDTFNILNSTINALYKFPEWGFAKGRQEFNEDPFDTACRELLEETSIYKESYNILTNILPFEETYIGTNGIQYRNIFFIANAKSNCMPYLDKKNKSQCREIGYISFFNFETAITKFRKHEYSKKYLLEKVHKILFINNIQNLTTNINSTINSTTNLTTNSTTNPTTNPTTNLTTNSNQITNPTQTTNSTTNLTTNSTQTTNSTTNLTTNSNQITNPTQTTNSNLNSNINILE